jgi:arsenate reductase (thioredoxin)
LKRVLFVCIGNACRSPMAEGFANHYGSDVLRAVSAGLAPIQKIPPDTVEAMSELDVDVSRHVPRRYDPFEAVECDVVVNMAGFKLPGPPPREVIEWAVQDPYLASIEAYRTVRDDLEQRVMRLILDLRKRAKQA